MKSYYYALIIRFVAGVPHMEQTSKRKTLLGLRLAALLQDETVEAVDVYKVTKGKSQLVARAKSLEPGKRPDWVPFAEDWK